MKKIVILVILLVPFCGMAQKEIKPSLPKAEKALRSAQYAEAKGIIDATVDNQEFMVDKKGGPSKNAVKAYYLKGLVYTAIDTTKNEAAKGLATNPLQTAKESFAKAYELDGGKSTSFITGPDPANPAMTVPVSDALVRAYIAQVYLERAIKLREEKEHKKAFAEFETTLYFLPKDTVMLFNGWAYFGPMAEESEKTIEYINRYFELGAQGEAEEAYKELIRIYYDKRKDNEKTLKVIKEARKKFPKSTYLGQFELQIYVAEKKFDLAKKTVQEDIKNFPNDKEMYLNLGILNRDLGNLDSAKIAYRKALELDPEYFDAQMELARIYYNEAKAVKVQRDRLGISAKDISQRKVLFDQLQEKYKVALPYWERAQKLNPDNEEVLYYLGEMYTSLVMDDKAAIVRKRAKQLGYSD